MSTASQGRAREHKVRDDLIEHGWELVARSAGSKGAADLVMASLHYGVALIQVGTPNKRLGPGDRARLCRSAFLCSGLALLAIVTPRKGVRYFIVTPEHCREEWSPDAH